MLQGATATSSEVRTGRRNPLGAGRDHGHRLRPLALDYGLHGLTGQGESHGEPAFGEAVPL